MVKLGGPKVVVIGWSKGGSHRVVKQGGQMGLKWGQKWGNQMRWSNRLVKQAVKLGSQMGLSNNSLVNNQTVLFSTCFQFIFRKVQC